MNKDTQSAILAAAGRYIRRLIQPIEQKLEQLEKRAMQPGPQGEPGPPGKDGQDGKDAAPVTDDQLLRALEPMVERQTAAWLQAHPPAPGQDGARGEPGPAGADGAPGQDAAPVTDEQLRAALGPVVRECTAQWLEANPPPAGADGAPGRDGASIDWAQVENLLTATFAQRAAQWELDFERRAQATLQRLVGPRGEDGRPGRDGENGRDALEIDVLPAIDLERSYSRGTYASHLGGIWVARRQTSGMDGWECIVNGYQGVELWWDENDALTTKAVLSNGETVAVTKRFPVPKDRGVYREGTQYRAGDGVTWAGSFWLAQADTRAKPDAGDGTWRLAVKRGRDGRDGKPKEPVVPPPVRI